MEHRKFKLVENFEKQEDNDESKKVEVNSWDRQRSSEQIMGFLARREAMIADLDVEL